MGISSADYKKLLDNVSGNRKAAAPTIGQIKARKGKYNNIKTEVDGLLFDSKKEAARYVELKQLLKSGQISDLQRQVKYKLEVNGQKICHYIADFIYVNHRGEKVTEDVKGILTDVYRLKKKLMKAIHSIEIKEV
jgi:hypothetical protein